MYYNSDFKNKGISISSDYASIKETDGITTAEQEQIVMDDYQKYYEGLDENTLVSLNPSKTISYFNKAGFYSREPRTISFKEALLAAIQRIEIKAAKKLK